MSDARTDFFSSAAKPAAAPSRDDFFAGKTEAPAKKKQTNFSSPYAYYDSEVRRAAGFKEADATPLKEVAPGINRGVADLAGIPMDLATSATDLLGAGYGLAAEAVTGKPAGEFFTPYDRAQVPGTGDWIANQMDSSPLGPITQPLSDDAGHRAVYGIARNAPSALTGGRGSIAPSMVGGTAATLAGEAGADPATQASIALLAGHGAGLADSPLPPSKGREVPAATPETVQDKLNKAASSQSMGAAGAAVDLQKLSPDLKMAVEKAVQKTGGAINPDVLARQIQADSLPVKVRLSEGQALGDERLISIEQNARGKHEAYSKGFQEQNKALVENLKTFRDEAGPDVFSTDHVQHGDTLIARYKAIDEARNAEIGAKYQALRDAAGGDFPIDTPGLLNNVKMALKKEHATNSANPDIMSTLEETAASGKIALEDFEQLRSSLARIQREGDGSQRHAAGVIRRQIEAMPLAPGAEQLKGLADAARAASRERFQSLDADPAYKAAVEDLTPPDKFVQKFVVGGTRDNVAKLAEAMGGDEAAKQTIKVATLDHLRQAAGISPDYNGNFTQAGYNKALQQLSPKMQSLLDPKTLENVTNLGDVARYTQFQPKGSFVNNSNTFVAAAGEKAADALEGALNYKTGGIPIASAIRKQLGENKVRKQAEATFAPGAGLTKLSELMKAKEKP